MTCSIFTRIIDKKAMPPVEKARNYFEKRYGFRGEWDKQSLPVNKKGIPKTELHILAESSSYPFLMDHLNMAVKVFGPLIKYTKNVYATKVRL